MTMSEICVIGDDCMKTLCYKHTLMVRNGLKFKSGIYLDIPAEFSN